MSLPVLPIGSLLAADHACAEVLAGVDAVAALSGSGGEAACQETGAWGPALVPAYAFHSLPFQGTDGSRIFLWIPLISCNSCNLVRQRHSWRKRQAAFHGQLHTIRSCPRWNGKRSGKEKELKYLLAKQTTVHQDPSTPSAYLTHKDALRGDQAVVLETERRRKIGSS